MNILLRIKKPLMAILLVCTFQQVEAQFLMDIIDTTKELGRGMLSLYKRFDHIRISGYMQPQFQAATAKGIQSYSGGDFATHVNNRFMLRRGRIRFDYARYNDLDQPIVHFAFQFDGTERGVAIRDFWGRFFENRWQLFMFTAGMFARPFGYEVNLSSSDRESPERGRMSQILMKTERDLGAMVSFEPRLRKNFLHYVKFDVGLFNGQGLSGPGEYDSYKDLITRLSLKPYPVTKMINVSAGLSFLQGGLMQPTQYVYRINGGSKQFEVDSSLNNIGKKAPRNYRGADMQWEFRNKWGSTILRGEYWWGTQTATGTESETPGSLVSEPYYIRKFNGAYFYLLQNIINKQHQVGVKYDWYDPNTDVKGEEINGDDVHMTEANIKYSTWGVGYLYYINEHLKLTLWYDMVKNESTGLEKFAGDVKDDVFTCRLQFRF